MYHGSVSFNSIDELDTLMTMASKYKLFSLRTQCIGVARKAAIKDVRVACELLVLVDKLTGPVIHRSYHASENDVKSPESIKSDDSVDWNSIKEECLENICDHFVSLTEHAISLSLLNMKKRTLGNNTEQSIDICELDSFLKLPISLLSEIIQRKNIRASQAVILLSLLSWIEHDIQQDDMFEPSSSHHNIKLDIHGFQTPQTPPAHLKLSESLKSITPIASNRVFHHTTETEEGGGGGGGGEEEEEEEEEGDSFQLLGFADRLCLQELDFEVCSEKMFTDCHLLFKFVHLELVPTDFLASVIECHPFVKAYCRKYGNVVQDAYRAQALFAQECGRLNMDIVNGYVYGKHGSKSLFALLGHKLGHHHDQSLPSYVLDIISQCVDASSLEEKYNEISKDCGGSGAVVLAAKRGDEDDDEAGDEGMTSNEMSSNEAVLSTPLRRKGCVASRGAWTPPPSSAGVVNC
jgi:hypothetical protein